MPGHAAFVLTGPTAAGKTAVAQFLAEQYGADILSADAMLVYRGLDIGTAKPTAEERKRVTYYGLDLVPPSGTFSVAQFLEVAQQALASTRAADRPLIVVGGTGLYVKALLQGLDTLPQPSPAVRARWRQCLAREGVGALQQALRSRAPAWLEAMRDPANGRRLVRALELVDAGLVTPPASWARQGAKPAVVGLSVARALLEARIAARVDAMYEGGLLREVAALTASVPFAMWGTAAQAVGYAEAVACLAGQVTEPQARERTLIRTRQLAKRQMTWFRHQFEVSWVECCQGEATASIAARVWALWQVQGPARLAL